MSEVGPSAKTSGYGVALEPRLVVLSRAQDFIVSGLPSAHKMRSARCSCLFGVFTVRQFSDRIRVEGVQSPTLSPLIPISRISSPSAWLDTTAAVDLPCELVVTRYRPGPTSQRQKTWVPTTLTPLKLPMAPWARASPTSSAANLGPSVIRILLGRLKRALRSRGASLCPPQASFLDLGSPK